MILIKHRIKTGMEITCRLDCFYRIFYYHLCVPVSGNEGRNGRHERNVLLYGSL